MSRRIDISKLPQESQDIIYEILDYVKMQLGFPIVEVEIEDEDIAMITRSCLVELSRYAVFITRDTVLSKGRSSDSLSYRGAGTFVVDVAKDLSHKLSYVWDVLKSNESNLTSTVPLIDGIPVGWKISGKGSMSGVSGIASDIMSTINERILMQRTIATIKDSISYDYFPEKGVLYVDSGYANSNITIEYIPILTLEDMSVINSDPDAMMILSNLVLAYSMVALGRARGKYSTSNYDWSVSSAELLEEGKSLLKELRRELITSYSMYTTD